MAVVLGTCPSHGTVEVLPESVSVFFDAPLTARYRFACPICETVVERPIDQQLVATLILVGAKVEHPPPITEGEICAFEIALDGSSPADIFAELGS